MIKMKTIVTIDIFLCEVILTYALSCSQTPSFVPVSSSFDLSNQLPTPIQAIVPSLRFECPSFITGGNIRAAGARNFDIQVWRPQDSTGTLYNLVWRREFRSTSTRSSSFVNSSFSMSPGVPVRSGDVIGFYSLEPARLLYTSSPQDEIVYTEASQGPLCNFSLNDTSVRLRTSTVPLISLTLVTATNQDFEAAEQRLPSIGNSCTMPLATTTSDVILTNNIPPTLVLSTREGDRQLATTSLIGSEGSDDITRLSSPVTEESSNESDADGKFLSLSLLEFILVVVIVAVVVTAISVVTGLVCCWRLHMKRLRMNNPDVTRDERNIDMNMNPAYLAVMTSQTLIQTGSEVEYETLCVTTANYVQDQSPDDFHHVHHHVTTWSTKPGVKSPRNDSNSICHYNSSHHSPDNDGYSYPNLGVESFQDNHG